VSKGKTRTRTATIANLTKIALRFRDARHWKQFHNAKDLALTLALEAAEVLEHCQWRNAKELEAHLRRTKADVADELADVLHIVLLLANDLEIDLGQAFREKMIKNARKYPIEKSRGQAKKYTEL
jgi:NTP pyrophosphatase (non-canonical NTP hydrolase)